MMIIILGTLSSCIFSNEVESKYTGFDIHLDKEQDKYLINTTVTMNIAEENGSPTKYNIYKKINEEEYEFVKETNASDTYILCLDEFGIISIKICAVLDGLELNNNRIIDFIIVESLDIEVQDISVANNIIDLYCNDSRNRMSLSDLEIIYDPVDTTERDLRYTIFDSENLEINENNVVQVVGYDVNEAPQILEFCCQTNDKAKANVYYRINNGQSRTTLTKFIIGYENQDYYKNDFVPFQCIEYANMAEADSYAVYRFIDGNYERLIENSNFLRKSQENGNTYYNVKIIEDEIMHLRFKAIINNEISETVYKDINYSIAEPPVLPTEIVLEETQKTICKDEEYLINVTLLPENATNKNVIYVVDSSDVDYIDINNEGIITPLQATSNPINIRVMSVSNNNIYKDLSLTILDLNYNDIVISYSGNLVQTVGETEDIIFSVEGLSDYTCKWYVDGNLRFNSATSDFVYNFNNEGNLLEARDYKIGLEIILDGFYAVNRELTVSLNSAIDLENFDDSYLMGEEIDLVANSAVPDTSISWALCSASHGIIENISGNTYIFASGGNYTFCAILKDIMGIPLEIKYSNIIFIEETASHEIFNLNMNGYNDGVHYAPYIMWKSLGNDIEYEVEIREGETIKTYSSKSSLYENNFTLNGFKVPYNDYNLNDTFEYRVRTNISNRWTPNRYYTANTITPQLYPYLDFVDEYIGMNCYINNIYDLGKLFNYLFEFQPTNLVQNEKIVKDLYFAIDYETDINQSLYEDTGGDITSNLAGERIVKANKLLQAAFRAYGVSQNRQISYENDAIEGVTISFDVINDLIINQVAASSGETNTIICETRYSENPRGTGNDVFPIDTNNRIIYVDTSNSLFLAASWGMKPLPTSNSDAERIYNEAKAVLNNIIDNSMSDMGKINAIYDYLATEVEYDYPLLDLYNSTQNPTSEQFNPYKSFHLEGVFDENIAVCDGISKAFTLLCAIENIPTMKIGGVANSLISGENHAWNCAMIDGKWYYYDNTWGRVIRNSNQSSNENYITVNHYFYNGTSDIFDEKHFVCGEFPNVAENENYFYFENENDLYMNNQNEFLNYASYLNNLYVNKDNEEYSIEFIIDYEIGSTLNNYMIGKIYGNPILSYEEINDIYYITFIYNCN